MRVHWDVHATFSGSPGSTSGRLSPQTVNVLFPIPTAVQLNPLADILVQIDVLPSGAIRARWIANHPGRFLFIDELQGFFVISPKIEIPRVAIILESASVSASIPWIFSFLRGPLASAMM